MATAQNNGSSFGKGVARRADLSLRAKYIDVDTTIYEVEEGEFVIHIQDFSGVWSEIDVDFNRNIRPATAIISLSNTVPRHGIVIEKILDKDIPKNLEGLSFTALDIQSLLLSKFQNLPDTSGVENIGQHRIRVDFVEALRRGQEEEISEFLQGIMPDFDFQFGISERPSASTSMLPAGQTDLIVRAARKRPNAPIFVKDDENFWFDNIDAIFENGAPRTSQILAEDPGMCCYVDGSTHRQIDIRQLLMMYDTIFLSPPLAENAAFSDLGNFWTGQACSREDLLYLIESGRVRIINLQPEERCDSAFLSAAYERNPRAVVGRRRSAALLAADVVNTARDYMFEKPEFRFLVRPLAQHIAETSGEDPSVIIEFLLWPLHARRSCFVPLLQQGLLGVGSFGIGGVCGKQLQRITGKDVRLEATIFGSQIQIAHALNATFICPEGDLGGWESVRETMGDRLNFYRSFNTRIVASWADNERRKEARRTILPPIPLFAYERYASVADIVQMTSRSSIRKEGRSLINRLANLPVPEREAEVRRLEEALYRRHIRRETREARLETLNAMLDLGSFVFDKTIFPVMSCWTLMKKFTTMVRGVPLIDRLADQIAQEIKNAEGSNVDLDFLSKVSRVAHIKSSEPTASP